MPLLIKLIKICFVIDNLFYTKGYDTKNFWRNNKLCP